MSPLHTALHCQCSPHNNHDPLDNMNMNHMQFAIILDSTRPTPPGQPAHPCSPMSLFDLHRFWLSCIAPFITQAPSPYAVGSAEYLTQYLRTMYALCTQ